MLDSKAKAGKRTSNESQPKNSYKEKWNAKHLDDERLLKLRQMESAALKNCDALFVIFVSTAAQCRQMPYSGWLPDSPYLIEMVKQEHTVFHARLSAFNIDRSSCASVCGKNEIC